jgi:hypothetical protein
MVSLCVQVTQLELAGDGRSLARVRSWKRVDGGGAVAGPAVDEEVLWSSLSGTSNSSDERVDGRPTSRRRPARAAVQDGQSRLLEKRQRSLQRSGATRWTR